MLTCQYVIFYCNVVQEGWTSNLREGGVGICKYDNLLFVILIFTKVP
jgi:hypothetical protein